MFSDNFLFYSSPELQKKGIVPPLKRALSRVRVFARLFPILQLDRVLVRFEMAPVPDPNNVGGGAKRDEATTKVPSKDPKKKDDKKEDDLVSSISHSLLKILLGF